MATTSVRVPEFHTLYCMFLG